MNRKKRYFLEVTFRPTKELDELRARITHLETELAKMSQYASLTLTLTDQLREAKARLEALGEDTSFIRLR